MDRARSIERLEQEMEQLRTALEAAQDEIATLSEERQVLTERVAMQARELRVLGAEWARARAAMSEPRPPDVERERLIQTEEELRVSMEELQVLAEELEATNAGIRGMNVRLEERVEERTRQIEESRAALAESEQRFRRLIESIPQLVWKSLKGGNWIWSSTQWCAFTGQSLEESLGLGWLDAVHPEDREKFLAAWKAADGSAMLSVEHRTWNAELHTWRWMQTRGMRGRGREGAIEWVGTSTDIEEQVQAKELMQRGRAELEAAIAARTSELEQVLAWLKEQVHEREQAEQGLRQSEKLKAIGQLTGGIAHDLNNMLQGITGSLSMIRARLRQERYSEIAKYVDRAGLGLDRAASLTQRLLSFARRQELSPEQVDMKRIARNMEELIRHTVGPGIQVELKPADGDCFVMCDANQMESAVLNLCINARDAMPDGGWLTVSTEELELTAAQLTAAEDARPGRYGSIAVTDTGTGMPPEIVARIFEPFFTTKPQGKGTGLGLSQIYGFIRQSGGVVLVDTAEGKGTTIRLCLPISGEGRQPGDATRETVQNPTILLVEDEVDVREMIAAYLRDAGYRVLEAEDGPAALRILQSHRRPDFLITDYGLPGGMNGRQVVEEVHKRYPGLPTIVITGFMGEDKMPDLEVMHKPFDPDVLMASIATILSGESS